MILLTGVAGFIGFHTARALLARGEAVLGIDSLNAYYDPTLKQSRLAQLAAFPNFTFKQVDVADKAALDTAVAGQKIDRIVHLAAQAGVRYSIDHPFDYASANLVGFLNMLELARHTDGLENFVYASSSSVYGNEGGQLGLEARCEKPVSLYAATKRSNEMMAHAYAHLYKFPSVGLRFFTVYGPYGRPDMAYFSFTKALYEERPITLYAGGTLSRDFTFIDDIVAGVLAALDKVSDGHRVFNLGNCHPEKVIDMVRMLEQLTGKTANIIDAPRAMGDVDHTWADISATTAALGYVPTTSLQDGLKAFVAWYTSYYPLA